MRRSKISKCIRYSDVAASIVDGIAAASVPRARYFRGGFLRLLEEVVVFALAGWSVSALERLSLVSFSVVNLLGLTM